ncbi:class I SAM-dependent methyltransferase [Marispirochaeta aestuarii]|uniref:class I SAM-dependent methyltransferase n=1 Tax=Marispirochaeta aestuarii TaxID=1963862 RepID=UPI002ABD2D4C|nr:class I SAM-dependent methyltransferase [Marispirochaeta aestuarii]
MPARIIRNGKLDLSLLHRLEKKPRLYEPGDFVFWTDPYISSHVLEAHLDPHSDDASRRAETIEKTLKFISEKYPPESHARLLDLGCGPGLYASGFHDAGYRVTGIDYSPVSIGYARDDARKNRREITYLNMDYREWKAGENSFEIVVMIFGDFCVLDPASRKRLLANIRRALSPGGVFLFDVFTEMYLPHPDERAWYTMLRDGFWSPDKNLVFEIKHRYANKSVHLNRYLIVTEDGTVRSCNLWHRWFERGEIREYLRTEGFEVEAMWADLAGTPLKPSPEWIGIAAVPEENQKI